jgi:2,3-bisphosphoglycerate-independent phosphoglycerate mutase
VIDGWGIPSAESPKDGDAIAAAETPVMDEFSKSKTGYTELEASSLAVGLPEGLMGNSEVGHLNIGAGRVVPQELVRIGDAVTDGSIAKRPAFTGLVEKLHASGGTCHLMGLMSPGGVHAHEDHAVALAKLLHAAGVPTVLHAFADGRDTPPQSAAGDLARLVAALPVGVRIGTVCGRYFAMDRDKRWDRVAKAYNVLVDANGASFSDPVQAVGDAYAHEVFDEFVAPAAIGDYQGMRDGDGILCFNFRSDRVREILGALLEPGFNGFPRPRVPRFVTAVGMTRYSDELAPFLDVMFPPDPLLNVLGAITAAAGRTQLRMAETEKFPHVTYFLNGGQETSFPGEDRIMVPSPKVATYDLQPEMSAPELTDKAVEAIGSGKYDLIVLNFANPDMVGHTGVLAAAIKAVETVDTGLGRIAAAVRQQGGALLVTADHGNCELMKDPTTGGPHTAHTTNKVPVVLLGGRAEALHDGRLADVAPTLLELMDLPKPAEMTGGSLILHHAAQAAE